MNRINELLLISSLERSEMDESLLRLATWLGIRTRVVTVPRPLTSLESLVRSFPEGRVCGALSADTLAAISQVAASGSGFDGRQFISERFARCLVYGFGSGSLHRAGLSWLACPPTAGLARLPEGLLGFRFSTEGKVWLQQLTGLEFEAEASGACAAFEVNSPGTPWFTPLLFAEERPVFVRAEPQPGTELFLWATLRVADVESPIPRHAKPEDSYPSLLPALIYLKACFGPRCWHNPEPKARLIVDDPTLHPQYGFLRYEELVESMRRARYGTTIAFIPWNYRRSKGSVARLFRASGDRLSLCIHGCDHTNQEFSRGSESDLTHRARVALQRMRHHRQTSGVSHENVMVFPQGHFSVGAIGALRKSGYLAAVDSSCYPRATNGEGLSLGDLMLPAVGKFRGLPIFPRRYPIQVAPLAVDLFLGKAALIVEHHEFLRDGYGAWEQFVARLNALDERLTWPGLSDIVMDSCLQRLTGEDRMDIRFFTPTFRWRNRAQHPVKAHLTKLEPEPELLQDVRVDGHPVPFGVSGGFVHLDIVVAPGGVVSVEVRDKEAPPPAPWRPGLRYEMSVLARRRLSEFRDNWLTKNPKLLGHAKGIMRRLKVTGDSHPR